MKKIIMLIAVLLMPFTFSYTEEVSIPAIWNKQMISAELYTTYSEDFYQYDNSRFSYHAFVPACVTSAKLPMNGDGATFYNNEHTVIFSISGGYNPINADTEWYYNMTVESVGPESITYSDWGNGWYAVSGVKNGKIYYIKGLVSDDRCCSFSFNFPYAEKDQYAWMVAILEDNFYLD